MRHVCCLDVVHHCHKMKVVISFLMSTAAASCQKAECRVAELPLGRERDLFLYFYPLPPLRRVICSGNGEGKLKTYWFFGPFFFRPSGSRVKSWNVIKSRLALCLHFSKGRASWFPRSGCVQSKTFCWPSRVVHHICSQNLQLTNKQVIKNACFSFSRPQETDLCYMNAACSLESQKWNADIDRRKGFQLHLRPSTSSL